MAKRRNWNVVWVGIGVTTIATSLLTPYSFALATGESVQLWPNPLFLTPLGAGIIGIIAIITGLAPDTSRKVAKNVAHASILVGQLPRRAWHRIFPPPPPTVYQAWSEYVSSGPIRRLYIRADPSDRSLPYPLVCQLFRLPGGGVARSPVLNGETPRRIETADFPDQFPWPVNVSGTFNFWWRTPGSNDDPNDPDGYSITLADGFFEYQPPLPSLEQLRGLR